jgi:uncharacterized protein (TIGR00251 family)
LERIVKQFASLSTNGAPVSDIDDLYTVDGDRFVLAVHVEPRAGRSAILGRQHHALRVRVAAPPVDERANQAVIDLLAEELGVAADQIELVAGQRSGQKRFRVSGLERDELDGRLRRTLRDADPAGGPRSRLRGE